MAEIDPFTGLTIKPSNTQINNQSQTEIDPIAADFVESLLQNRPQRYVGDRFPDGEISRYDKNITHEDLSNIEGNRAKYQPNSLKALNAVVGGVVSGGLTAIETGAHMLNFKNHIERLMGVANVEQNAISEAMSNLKEDVSKIMPIYRYDSNKVIDFSDPGFYWSAVKGIIDSAVGFAIPGMGATKLVGAAQRLARVNGYLSFLKASKSTSQIVNSLASGYLTNMGEGMIMGVEQYENSMEAMKTGLMEDIYSDLLTKNPDLPQGELYKLATQLTQEQLANGKEKEFSKIAGEEADSFLSRNRIFMVTDAIGLHGLYKGKGLTRNLIKEKGLKASAKRLTALSGDNLLLQSGKEALEEIGQNVLQMEGQYQAEKKAGLDVSDRPEDLLDRAYEFATSDQALLEGAMGMFGGGPQRILTEAVSGNLSRSAKDRELKMYQDQQEQIAQNKAFLQNKLNLFSKGQDLRLAAIAKGEDNVAEFIKSNEFILLATENFARGTTENLERQLQDIVEGVSEEERIANGWDENYKQQAQDQLKKLTELEKAYNRYTKYENQSDVFLNRETRNLLQEDRDRIKSSLDDINSQLESQEEGMKDEELIKRQKDLTKDLETSSKHIKEIDNKYKEMTSAKAQEALRKQKKESIETAKKAGKLIRETLKKKDQEQKAKERKERNKNKKTIKDNKEQEEKATTEKDTKTSSTNKDVDVDTKNIKDKTKNDDLDVSILSDDVKDKSKNDIDVGDISEDLGKDLPDVDKVDANPVKEEEKKAAKEEFDKLSDELFDDLEANIKPESIQGTDQEPLSSAQKSVGILEKLIDAAVKSKGKEKIGFEELMDLLLERHGSKRVGSLFNMIQGLWVQSRPQDLKKMYRDFNDYLELTSNESSELDSDEKRSKTLNNEQFTNATVDEVLNSADEIAKEIARNNQDTPTLEAEYLRVERGSDVLAYLSRLYKQTKNLFFSQRNDVDNEINKEIQDKQILDPDKYPVGTEVTLIVEDNNDTPVYVDSSTTGEKVRTTWGKKKESWIANKVEGESTRYKELYAEEVPIAVYVNGKKIGYLHETSWINSTNIHGDVNKDKERSKKIRNHITSKGSFTTKISQRTNGYLWRVANRGTLTTNEAIPDKNIPILIQKNGTLYESRNKPYSGSIINKTPLKEGVSYVVVPVGDGNIALPLINKKLSESENVVKSIRKALEIFMTNDQSEEAQAFVNSIFEATGKNIMNPVGISDYVNMFINLTDTGDTNLKTYLLKNTSESQTKDGFAAGYIRGDDWQFETGLGRALRTEGSISRARVKVLNKEQLDRLFNIIEETLKSMYMNISLDSIGDSDAKTVILNNEGVLETVSYKDLVREMTKSAFMGQNIANEGEAPKYIYTVQPVITLDFNEIDNVDNETGKPIIGKSNEKEVKIATDVNPEARQQLNQMGYNNTQIDNLSREDREYILTNGIPSEEFFKEEKGKPQYDDDYEGDMDFEGDYSESLFFESIIALSEEKAERLKELAEVKEEVGGDEVSGVIISAFGSAAKQKQVLDYVRSKFIDKLFTEKRASRKKTYKEILDHFLNNRKKIQANLEIAKENNDTGRISKYSNALKELDTIIDNWSKIEKLVIQQLRRIDDIVIHEVSDEDEEINEEEKESDTEKNNWSDVSAVTTNPTTRLAPQLKRFLSGIGEWVEDPNNKGTFIPSKNYFGAQKIMNFWDVYNTLQRLTSGVRPNYNDLIKELNKYSESYPFIKEIITKLENAPSQVKNQFVSGLTNHHVDMKFIMFGRNKEGSFELTEYSSDANDIQRIILNDWNNNAIQRLGRINPEGDDVFVDTLLAQSIIGNYERMIKTDKYTEDEVAGLLGQFGIELTEKTWKDIKSGNFKYGGRTQTLESFVKTSVLKILVNNLKKYPDNSLIAGNKRFIDETVVKVLSRHDAKYRTNAYSNSYRAGVKTVYSYSLNKYLVNRTRDLKENGLAETLAKLSFNGRSAWLKSLLDDGSGFKENFAQWVVSLEALKKQGTKSKGNKELNKVSDAEVELYKIGMLQSSRQDISGLNNRVVGVLYPTTSDKTLVMGLTVIAQDLSLDIEGNITDKSINRLTELLVYPELERIRMFREKNERNKISIKGYNQGASQFLMFPEMNTLAWLDSDNNIQKMFNDDGSINENIYSDEATNAIRNTVKEHFNSLLEKKLEFWQKSGIGVTDKNGNIQFLNTAFLEGMVAKQSNPVANVKKEFKVKAAATDMIYQYLIANAEVHKVFTGDPALYYKQASINKGKSKTDEDYDFVADAKETYDNINKRLAADIAPGTELAESTSNVYNQVVLKDARSASISRFEITEILDGKKIADQLRSKWKDVEEGKLTENQFNGFLKGLKSQPYYGFDGTDAQEYVTWKEHLYVMKQLGEISEEEYNDAYKTLSEGKDLKKELVNKVMQPMKPVYVDNQIDELNDVEKRIYIKSSAFPLLPQLTRGLSLDNLRLAMERDKIDRVAFSTAVKIGGVDNPSDIWTKDGKVKNVDEISFQGSVLQLSRKGFRIQQSIPYDPKKSVINKVTQASKNLFVNILEVDNFILDGQSYTGKALQEEYYKLYGKLHEMERQKLIEEIGYDPEEGTLKDISALRNVLINEARERNYPISDQELLELDEELKFLAFSPSANKYESLLNSIVTNRIIKIKMPGKSFVLGSEEGFNSIMTDEEEIQNKIDSVEGIVFTDKWEGRLLPSRIGPNGERLPSQVLVPWKFKTLDGKKVDIKQYTTVKDGKTVIDTNKLPEELLQMFGMRIPNQGLNSQGLLEIVGFLPESQGDLLIATRDFVVQMGSDFDVDKLYTYTYSYYFDNNGNIKPHREIKKHNESDVLKNRILDIHMAIHRNPDNRIQSQIVNPLGVWKLGDIAKDVTNLREERNTLENKNSQKKDLFTGLSDEYQKAKFKEGTSGKAGVGVFSVDSSFNAIVQGKNLKFMTGENISLVLTIGDKTSRGDLSKDVALDEETYKSDVIAGYQSAAVDNAKDPILDKLNINTHTFKVIKILNQLGFTEEVPYILTQDIIVDYVEELGRLSGAMAEYTRNREEAAYEIVYKKYNKANYNAETDFHLAEKDATIENLKNYIKLGDKTANYHNAQIAILDLFRRLNEYGQVLQTVQSSVNVDTKGVGKSVLESIVKEEQVYSLLKSTDIHISNASKLIGDMRIIDIDLVEDFKEQGYEIRYFSDIVYAIKPDTINGHAIVNGLFLANDMWSNLFPYQSSVVNALFTKVEKYTKSEDFRLQQKAERRKIIWNNLKSFLFTRRDLGLYDSSIENERMRLLYDKWEEKKYVNDFGFEVTQNVKVSESLGAVIKRVQTTKFGINNPFLSKLNVEFGFGGDPTIIKYNASAAENIDETDIYSAILNMLTVVDPSTNQSPIVGKFNNKDITLRELAQELILYSYITGGLQEAVQFVKYIPASYLKTTGFADNLSNIALIESHFGINPNIDEVLDYYQNIPPFVEQYLQHNPDQVPSVSVEKVIDADGKDANTINSFTISKETREKIGQFIKDNYYPPKYLSISNSKSPQGSNLYEFDLKTKRYNRIDTLGSFANNEYNADVPNQLSLIPKNKPVVREKSVQKVENTGNPLGDLVDDEITPTGVNVNDIQEKETVTSILEKLKDGNLSSYKRTDGKKAIKELLNEIIATEVNPYLSTLAEELLSVVDILPDETSIDFVNRLDSSTAGYYTIAKTKYNDDPHTLVINTSAMAKRPNEIVKTLLHELLHGLTSYKIFFYTYSDNKKAMDKLQKYSPKLTQLSKEEERIIKSMDILFKYAKAKILSNPTVKAEYLSFVEKLKKRDEDIKFTNKEISMFYGLTDLNEFVAVALTDAGFAEILNNILAPNNQETVRESLLKKLVNLLKKIMRFNVKEGTILEQTIYNTLDLINAQKKSNEYIENDVSLPTSSDRDKIRESDVEKDDIDIKDLPDDIEAFDFDINPKRKIGLKVVVSDKEVLDLMKHCKGI